MKHTWHSPVLAAGMLAATASLSANALDSRSTDASPYRQWTRGPSADAHFFPLAVWLQSPSHAEQYRQAGFNLYVGLWNGPTEDQLAALKQAGDGEITVLGSTEVVRTLLRHGLVDELTVMVAPVVLGGGRRLFDDDGVRQNLDLVSTATSSTGVLRATYRPNAGV